MIFPSQALSLSQQHLLHKDRYLVLPQWLAKGAIDAIRLDTLAIDAAAGFESGVGTSSQGTMRLDHDVRRSRQCNLYPPPANTAGSVDTRAALIEAANGLRAQLQASVPLGLPHLAPFSTELNHLLYPSGGHYMRHLDDPTLSPGQATSPP